MSWLQGRFVGPVDPPPTAPAPPVQPGELPETAPSPDSLEVASSSVAQDPPPTIKVAVLLDGDADLFTSAYLLKGYRGGRSAALDLRNKVNSLVHSRYRHVAGPLARPPELYVVAQSFLNMAGLSHHLLGVDLRSFAQGFSSSGLAFSMVDVGCQRQAADDAIKGHLPFLLATCDVVLLGGSHDGGYAADLLRLDPEVLRTKVLLLRTTDFAAERILELGLEEVRFEGLFDGTDPSSGRKPAFLTRASAPAMPFFAPTSSAMSHSVNAVRKTSVPRVPGATTSAVKPPVPASFSSTVALRPSGLVVPCTSSRTSAASASQQASTSTTPPAPTPYAPLVLVLRDFASRGQRRVSRHEVDVALRARYPALGGYLRRYALEAALKGLVRLGKGKTGEVEWVELVEEKAGQAGQAVQAAPQVVQGSKTVGGAGGKGPVASTSAPPAVALVAASKPTSTASSSTTAPSTITTTHKRFLPLIHLLESQRKAGRTRPLCAYVGEKLAKACPGLYAHFTTFCREAEREGIVRMGVGEKLGSEWIELVSKTPMSRPVSSAPSASPAYTIPSSFDPLVSILLDGSSPVLPRSQVEAKFDALDSRPYEPGKFKLYVSRAEQARVVDTGSKDKEGEPLVKLTAAARTAAKRESKRFEPNMSSAVPSATASSSAFVVPLAFVPLVSVLRSVATPTASWTTVGDKLNKVIPTPYETGKFRAYVERAEQAGVVETGKREKEGQHWMRLTSSARAAAFPSSELVKPASTTSASTSASSAADNTSGFTIPVAFLPLVTVLLSISAPSPAWTHVGAQLNQLKPLPYLKGKLKAYVEQAEAAGIVETGESEAEGQHWMRLTAAARAAVQSLSASEGAEKAKAPEVQPARPGCC
ncbi:uncharacterized protein RHOBADRAFT_41377 [Rhodotorula graminis WP1]|uniref:DUF7923 domain-containing protein n=1 Tax=Rhodotorula graminis (strain WP1) TaxID=578459 RepID=A0A194S9X2_RHOGW|nr:uncharacterized protein RHOBADRAFT_41377 [Rhodotorula graminis WP1]KPV77384.1 hypothetical protein RHOBADRAFT_41377 [Rhodotorula graminis WP1]